jgi:Holliday junction DNA helicase RuvA
MIASVRGTLLSVGIDHVVVETGGVGLLVYVPRPLLGRIGAVGDEVRLYTHLHIREDLLALYGFATPDEKALFELLLTVTGVGPAVALGMLSSGSPDELRMAIAAGDTARLARVPRVGKKMAERLVLELKNKIDLRGLPLPAGVPAAMAAANSELAEMLAALGFSAAEANAAIASLPPDAPEALEERLRLALRYFGGQ